jgi:glutathione S-transferase
MNSHPPIVMRRVLKAPPARVFDALINPDLIRRWMCPESLTVVAVENDPVVGGRFRIEMHEPDGRIYPAHGTYREIRPPQRLAFSWIWETGVTSGVETEITIELTAQGNDTLFVMTHRGLPSEEERQSHDGGWTSAINQLERMFS